MGAKPSEQSNPAPEGLDPEATAGDLLLRADWSEESCVRLLRTAFSHPVPNRRAGALGPGDKVHYFVLGGFSKKGLVGISPSSRNLPRTCQYINKWLQRVFPGQSWASIAIAHNHRVEPHRDSSNEPQSFNHSVSLGPFSGGQLLVQDDCRGSVRMADPLSGQEVWGTPVTTKIVGYSFPPSYLHCTMPWQGDRWSMTAYTPAGLDSLSAPHRRCLADWGLSWAFVARPSPQPAGPPSPKPHLQGLTRQVLQRGPALSSGDGCSRQVSAGNPAGSQHGSSSAHRIHRLRLSLTQPLLPHALHQPGR